MLESMRETEARRIQEEAAFFEEAGERARRYRERERRGELTETDRELRRQDKAKEAKIRPTWLLWRTETYDRESEGGVESRVTAALPRVLASFEDGEPFLLERRIGLGKVVFVTSGLRGQWNTLMRTNAALLFDRIVRSLLQGTLPGRNFSTSDQIQIPLAPRSRGARILLQGPDGREESLAPEAQGSTRYGVTLRNAAHRGMYRLHVEESSGEEEGPPLDKRSTELVMAVNGPPEESDLRRLEESSLAERVGQKGYRWISAGESISLEGARIRGQYLWKYLMGGVLLLVLAEIFLLARPSAREGSP
jgi:hypothetical protein